jgi:hypothetical protein
MAERLRFGTTEKGEARSGSRAALIVAAIVAVLGMHHFSRRSDSDI